MNQNKWEEGEILPLCNRFCLHLFFVTILSCYMFAQGKLSSQVTTPKMTWRKVVESNQGILNIREEKRKRRKESTSES